MTNVNDFYEYVKSFYGKGEFMGFDASNDTIYVACCMVARRKDQDFCGDSMDRERVRLLLEEFGYSEQPRDAEEKHRAKWSADVKKLLAEI